MYYFFSGIEKRFHFISFHFITFEKGIDKVLDDGSLNIYLNNRMKTLY